MAFGGQWDAEKMLDLYIYDYMVKKNLRKAAEIFAKEANVGNNPVAIDAPYGFLTEWWTIFWDMYSFTVLTHPEAMEKSSVKPTQMMENEQQNICPTVPTPHMNQQRARQFSPRVKFEKMMGQPAAGHDSHSWQQIPQKAQLWTASDKNHDVSLGKTIPVDLTPYAVPKAILPRAGLHDAVMEKGAYSMLLKEWPLTDTELNSIFQVPNQLQHSQTSMALCQAKAALGKLISPFQGSTNNLGSLMLPRNELSGTDGRMLVPKKQTVEQRIMVPMGQTAVQNTMAPVRQTAQQQQKDQLAQQQLHEDQNSRKRKNLSNSQAEANALDGRDADVEKASDDNIESFLSHDEDNTDIMSNSFSNLPQRSSACGINGENGFSFKEVGSLHSSKGKVLCCHFSSDGKLLASAGHDKKVLLWNMNTFDFVSTVEGHSHLITDVRFRPSSRVFATSSFDRTVQIWDASKPSKSLFKLVGHAGQVTSLDFHPRKMDLLCSCDSNDEIRLWNFNECACMRIFKGATRQVRFQPRVGDFLGVASGNEIGLFDVETNSLQYCLEGHIKEVRSICWDTSGKYIASVSEDSARVWSVVSDGKCTHVLHSNGNKFESCTFHPGYSQVLVIGSYQSLDLWNPTENKTLTVAAHNGIIAALADSPQTEMIASASHDRSVRVWR